MLDVFNDLLIFKKKIVLKIVLLPLSILVPGSELADLRGWCDAKENPHNYRKITLLSKIPRFGQIRTCPS